MASACVTTMLHFTRSAHRCHHYWKMGRKQLYWPAKSLFVNEIHRTIELFQICFGIFCAPSNLETVRLTVTISLAYNLFTKLYYIFFILHAIARTPSQKMKNIKAQSWIGRKHINLHIMNTMPVCILANFTFPLCKPLTISATNAVIETVCIDLSAVRNHHCRLPTINLPPNRRVLEQEREKWHHKYNCYASIWHMY